MGLLKIVRPEETADEQLSSDNPELKLDGAGTETLTIIVTDDDDENQHVAEFQESDGTIKESQMQDEIGSNSSISIKNAKHLLQSDTSRTFKVGNSSVKLISKPHVAFHNARIPTQENFRLFTKRKMHFDDFKEGDLDDPKKARIIWNLAKQEINMKDSKIELLEKHNAKLTARMYELKDLRTVKRKNYILNQEVSALRQLLDLKNFHKAIGDILDI